MKNTLRFSLIMALLMGMATPSIHGMQAISQVSQLGKQGLEKAKRFVACLAGKSQCDKSEITRARLWAAGVSAALFIAVAAVVGIPRWQAAKLKEKEEKETKAKQADLSIVLEKIRNKGFNDLNDLYNTLNLYTDVVGKTYTQQTFASIAGQTIENAVWAALNGSINPTSPVWDQLSTKTDLLKTIEQNSLANREKIKEKLQMAGYSNALELINLLDMDFDATLIEILKNFDKRNVTKEDLSKIYAIMPKNQQEAKKKFLDKVLYYPEHGGFNPASFDKDIDEARSKKDYISALQLLDKKGF